MEARVALACGVKVEVERAVAVEVLILPVSVTGDVIGISGEQAAKITAAITHPTQ
jgi:hypothetical protein